MVDISIKSGTDPYLLPSPACGGGSEWGSGRMLPLDGSALELPSNPRMHGLQRGGRRRSGVRGLPKLREGVVRSLRPGRPEVGNQAGRFPPPQLGYVAVSRAPAGPRPGKG